MIKRLSKFDKTTALPEEKEAQKVIRIGFPGRETVKDILDAVIDFLPAPDEVKAIEGVIPNNSDEEEESLNKP